MKERPAAARFAGRSLDRDELRRRLEGSCPPEDLAGLPAPSGVPAAVLVGLVADPKNPGIVLTERTVHLKNHPAQVSFPGGRVEACDAEPEAAALREAFEEIGVPPQKVEILGCLPLHETVTGFLVHPFVGWIQAPVHFVPDPREVAEVFQVPLGFIVDSRNHLWETAVIDEERYSFHVIYYRGRRIWGATAAILVSLARVLSQ